MTEEENQSVETEESVATAQADDSEDAQESQEETAQALKSRNTQEYNWAEARRRMQELDRQNKEMQEQITRLQPANRAQPEEDELDKLSDDDIITKAQAKKLAMRMAKSAAIEAIRERDASTVDERLGLKFPDFGEIVTRENVELLKQNEPELALSLVHIADPYSQGVAAYKLLKRLGIGEEMKKPIEKDSKDRDKAMKNSQKPVSVNAVAKQSAIGSVHMFENGLTPELKAQLQKEMEEARKRA